MHKSVLSNLFLFVIFPLIKLVKILETSFKMFNFFAAYFNNIKPKLAVCSVVFHKINQCNIMYFVLLPFCNCFTWQAKSIRCSGFNLNKHKFVFVFAYYIYFANLIFVVDFYYLIAIFP